MNFRTPQYSFAKALIWITFPLFIALFLQTALFAADTTYVHRIAHPPHINDMVQAMQSPDSSSALLAAMTRIDRFRQYLPYDGAEASERTIVYIGYDTAHFYAAFLCFDKEPNLIRANLANRDNFPADNESVALQLDPFRDGKRMYGFQCNPLGVQTDGFYTEGIGWDLSFNTIWQSEGRVTPQGYAVLITIPFKNLRYPASALQTWGIFLFRGIERRSEQDFFPYRTIKIQSRMQQEGVLSGLENLPSGQNVQVIPYLSARRGEILNLRQHVSGGGYEPKFEQIPFEAGAGVDIKTVLGGNIVLDATFNPDFSQVESDQPQITANQRFEVFFPERRPFFLENASFFETPINTVFSRRIQNPQGGIRLTGKVGEYSVGVLLSDDQAPFLKNPDLAGSRAWFGAARVNKDIFLHPDLGAAGGIEASGIGASYTGHLLAHSYNHLGSIDTRLQISNNWTFTGQALMSYSRPLRIDTALIGTALLLQANYADAHCTYTGTYNERSPGFHTEVGFVPRVDIRNIANNLAYRFRPPSSPISSWGGDVITNHIWDYSGIALEASYKIRLSADLVAQSQFSIDYTRMYEALRPQDSYAVSKTQGFWQENIGVMLASNVIKQANLALTYNTGSRLHYTPARGKGLELVYGHDVNATLSLRFFPELVIDNTYLLVRQAHSINNAHIFENHIVRSRWNYQITREASLRAIVQYSILKANEEYSLLESRRNVNVDILLTYLVHPGTALFLGFNNNFQNYDPALIPLNGGLMRSESLYVRDSWQVFVKASYLLGL